MTNCNDGLIADNDFSFNSAIGIGMYRSSRNNIMHNKLDFNVRGYSHGFYNRGQDSAGILVFEQFAYNSVTHCGDGFFLWAGQTTMDSGEGGCNENYIYANDFSYAPTNGIEVTFSKNHIRYNTIKECDHGVWGGYSWETSIGQNKFEKNRIGVAIEHGQNNAIISNQFNNDKEAIKLWARKQQPSDWGYANKRDIRSMHYRIWENDFTGNKTALNITMTDETEFINNKFSNVTTAIKKDSSVTNFKETIPVLYDSIGYTPPIINNWKNKKTPFLKIPAGKKQIRITEWGPYDYRYPIIFLNKIDSNNVYYFDVLGPKGKWKIKKLSGAENVSIKQGVFPAAMQVKKTSDDLQLELEYTGEAFTNQFGNKQEANMPYTFSFRDYTPTMAWNVKWWRWYVDTNPIKAYSWIDYLKERVQPNDSAVTNKLDYTWWGKPTPNVPADTFITIATSTINVQKGMYRLGITADDLVKVYVDEKLVIDFWDVARYINDEDAHHEATVELNGRHNIRVEHTENAGYATLIFTLKPL
jgi:parallel beta-helix repeat protein